MEKVRIENVRPGMVLGRSIYATDGRILISKKTELSASLLAKLKDLRLPSAYIETSTGGEIQDLVSDTTRSELMHRLSKLDSELRSGNSLNLLSFKQPLYNMIEEIISNQKNAPVLADIRLHNDYTYGHSIHVCIIAVKIGLKIGYDQKTLTDLAIGALFHDIGMTKISVEILSRIGGLTKDELRIVQNHPKLGFEMLRQIPDIPQIATRIAGQHHERYNGNGYPRGIAGTEIDEFARITAVADVFDAMTTEKIYRYAKSVSESISYIKSQKTVEFDPEVVDVLEQVVS
jgi:putative nucleotidyltransferase with HDIG domain